VPNPTTVLRATSLQCLIPLPYYDQISDDKIEKNETSEACSAYGGKERFIGYWWGNLRERDHVEDPGVDGRIIIWIFRKWEGG
jgi:hypothetical protein